MKTKKYFLLALSVVALVNFVAAQNISEWRGPSRTGIYHEEGLLRVWPENGPTLLWHAEKLPKGYSSLAVTNETIYFTGLKDSLDILVAIDFSGNVKWQTVIGKSWVYSFPDSRCTPTVEGDKVYVTSGTGDVACVNAASGEIIWKVNAVERFKGRFSFWGCVESLLIDGDKVFFTAGGDQTSMVALNKKTGETIWSTKTLNDTMAYASPMMAHFGEKKLIFNILTNNLVGVDPETGVIVCNFEFGKFCNKKANRDWIGASFTNTFTPIVNGKDVYITGGYDHVGVKLRLSDDLSKLTPVWVDSTLDIHHGGAVLINGYIYGSNWINNGNGNWCCIDWETGKTMYETKWKTKGSIIANDDMLYCYEEKTGYVALVKATPEEFKVISSFKVPFGTGPCWSHMVIKNGVLYVRRGDAIMAYKIK